MKSFTRVLFAVVALLLGACYPESKNPIAPASMNVDDATLEGTWCIREKGQTVFYHMHRSAKDARGRMSVVGVEVPKSAEAMTQNPMELVTARIAGVQVLSFRNTGTKEKKTFGFMRYEVDWRGRLKLWMADSNVFADAVLAGKLRGSAKKNQFGADVTLTDSSERIAAFVGMKGAKSIFKSGEPIVMEKVR
jgi:hypothetical protein